MVLESQQRWVERPFQRPEVDRDRHHAIPVTSARLRRWVDLTTRPLMR